MNSSSESTKMFTCITTTNGRKRMVSMETVELHCCKISVTAENILTFVLYNKFTAATLRLKTGGAGSSHLDFRI